MPSTPVVTARIALSNSDKPEVFLDSLETQFQQVTDSSVPVVIETVEMVLRSYFLTPTSEPNLTNPTNFRKPPGVSRSARLRAQTVSQAGP